MEEQIKFGIHVHETLEQLIDRLPVVNPESILYENKFSGEVDVIDINGNEATLVRNGEIYEWKRK